MINQDEINQVISEIHNIESYQFKNMEENEIFVYFVISGYTLSSIDGQVDEEEIEAIKGFIELLTENKFSTKIIDFIIFRVKAIIDNYSSKMNIFELCYEILSIATIDYIEKLRKKSLALNDFNAEEYKDKYLYNLYRIAYADGLFHPNEQEAIKRIANYHLFIDEEKRIQIRNRARLSTSFDEKMDSSKKKYLKLRYDNINKPRIYLAGPFKNFESSILINHFNDVRNKYDKEFHFFNPYDREIFYKDMENDKKYREIANDQKQDILNSDILIAYLPRPSIGTAMAIQYAYSISRIVIVISNKTQLLSDMLPAHATVIVDDFDSAISECRIQMSLLKDFSFTIFKQNGEKQKFCINDLSQYLNNIIYKSGVKDIFDMSSEVFARTISKIITNKVQKKEINPDALDFSVFENIVESYFISIADTEVLKDLAKSYIHLRMKTKETLMLDSNLNTIDHEAQSFVHDLKAPLGSIRRNLLRLVKSTEILMPHLQISERDEFLLSKEIALKNCETADNRIKNFLLRIKKDYVKSVINVEEKLKKIFFQNFNSSNSFKLKITKDDVVYLNIIESKFERIFENLIKNSFEHGFNQMKFGNIYIDIKSREIENALLIHFWNDGKSIGKEEIPFIFDSIHNMQTRNSGMGLGGVKKIVEDMGGNIYCEHQENLGPKFTIAFYNSHEVIGTKVLLAEDEEIYRDEYKMFLKRKGFECTEAGTVHEAIDKLGKEQYSAILCDIDFKEEHRNGLDIIRYIRDNNIQMKIIIVTGSSNIPHWKERAKDYQPDKILYKDDIELESEILEILKW